MYYHLISGVDFPLKSNKEIHDFFNANYGKEFIAFSKDYNNALLGERVGQWHFMRNIIGRREDKLLYRKLSGVESRLITFQKNIGINRVDKLNYKLYKGSNWFSITDNMARFICQNKKKIKCEYRFTSCCDEVFLHSYAMMSPYANNIYDDDLRYTDWKRGNPYIFTIEDYDILKSSNKLFARKFDEKKDLEIINRLYDLCHNKMSF